MKSWELSAFGVANLTQVEREDPRPGPGQVSLQVLACSLNYRDLLMVRGEYDPRLSLPLVPLSDAVCRVVEVGDGVTRVGVGDRVCPIFSRRWIAGDMCKRDVAEALGGPIDGTLRERLVLSEESVVAAPEHLSDAEAATLPCAAVTAWNALAVSGNVRAGDTVLVQGTGGVSIFSLQLAKVLGARVIATSSSDEKLERARALGADETINYVREPKWGKIAKDLTGGRGVDHVIEVGGAGTLAQSLRAVRPAGTISLIGILAGNAAEGLLMTAILMQAIRVQGIFVGSRDTFESLNRAVAQHVLRPVIDRVFPFAEAPAAFAHLEARAHFGKVVVSVP